jgi:hypothetical protein
MEIPAEVNLRVDSFLRVIKSNLVFYANPFFLSSNSNFCFSENSTLLPCRAVPRLSKRLTAPLELTMRHMGHIGFVIPWVYHFLSHLRSLLARAQNKRTLNINNNCMRDFKLMQGI